MAGARCRGKFRLRPWPHGRGVCRLDSPSPWTQPCGMRSFLLLVVVLIVLVIAVKRVQTPRGPLPDLTGLTFVEGRPVLSGRPVLLEFWATWCPPCRDSIPHLNAIHEKFGRRGLVVLGVTQEDRATVAAFRRQVPMRYSIGLDPEAKAARALGVRGIPHAFLADRTGRIIWDGHPGRLTDEQVERVFQ